MVSDFNLLSEPIRSGLKELGLDSPTGIQTEAFAPILEGQNVLLIAPTGTGKTEAAVLPILDTLLRLGRRAGISLLYITPLRALDRDMLRRLRFWADRLGLSMDVRHGDTTPAQRRRQSSCPPDVLITTPETLQAMLPSKSMRRHLRSVRWVIVDEVHNLAESKRGTQLAVALERLREIAETDFQRIGLSATIGSPQAVADFLGGAGREVLVLQASTPKEYEYGVVWPSPGDEARAASEQLYTSPEAAARILLMKEMVDAHRSTLIFVNSRQHAEMLGLRFNMLGKGIAVHHGSLSKEERQRVEEEFKSGSLKAIVCTSTLELGIDVGSVDCVLQYLSPRQVASLIQRVGRSGHRVGGKSFGTIVCASTDDFVESLAAVKAAKDGFMEPIRMHENALDVLAHQCAGLVMDFGKIGIDDIMKILRRAHPYRNLPAEELNSVLEYMRSLGK
ncbi:MAG: DEAD/DEAH box helicase, partial [Thermoproteota archaeon]